MRASMLACLATNVALGLSAAEAAETDVVALLQNVLEIHARIHPEGPGRAAETLDGHSHLLTLPATGNTTDAIDTAAEATGVTMNSEGDLATFIVSLCMYSSGVFFFAVCFMVFKHWYPCMYVNNITIGIAPRALPEGRFGWISASLATTTDEAADSIGLDNAMLLEFCNLCMKICAIIGLPMFCIMGPLNCIFGGKAAGEDYLSYLSFGNVEFGSWLYWVHAFVVWGVVLVVRSSIFRAQEEFLVRRYKWLRELPEPRSTTVLVEGIPDAYRSDDRLETFFKQMFDGTAIKSAYIVKDTGRLYTLKQQQETQQQAVAEAMAVAKGNPTQQLQESIDQLKGKLDDTNQEIKQEREKFREEVKVVGNRNLSNGFVTFHSRKDAELSKTVQYSSDADEWVVSTPPGPESVLWADLKQDQRAAGVRTVIGYALVFGLYGIYLPAVLFITNIAMKIKVGPLQPLWASVAPTVGLQVMVAFMPTFLILIFRFFFTLKDDRWAQQRLQNWYFAFQVVFVILVTAIGSNIVTTSKAVVNDPMQIFSLLADTMPPATHFYMVFLVLQWFTHGMNLTRYFQLFKFLVARKIWDDEDARALIEPEDQDYYGSGSRCARFAINMCITLIFGTLCPPIMVLGFINFAVCRLFYGYLIVFAETKKPDLGGVFWVHQLKHIFVGTLIYCVLMTGVLYRRSASSGPAWISAVSFFFIAWSYYRFNVAFAWEKLPHAEVVAVENTAKPSQGAGYVQDELLDA